MRGAVRAEKREDQVHSMRICAIVNGWNCPLSKSGTGETKGIKLRLYIHHEDSKVPPDITKDSGWECEELSALRVQMELKITGSDFLNRGLGY